MWQYNVCIIILLYHSLAYPKLFYSPIPKIFPIIL